MSRTIPPTDGGVGTLSSNSPMRTLSKSDFKVALECPTKLYYRKIRFPNTIQYNDFLHVLAE